MKINSVKFEISILYVSILGLLLIIYQVVLYFSLQRLFYERLDEELKVKAQEITVTIGSYLDAMGDDKQSLAFTVERVIRLEGEHPYSSKVYGIEGMWLQQFERLNLKEDYINFLNWEGKSIVCSSNMPHKLLSLFIQDIWQPKNHYAAFKNIRLLEEKLNLRVISLPVYFKDNQHYILQIGSSLENINMLLNKRLANNIIGIILILVLAHFISRLLVARILKPVSEITRTAKNITLENLSARVKVDKIDMEMQNLAEAFNAMISRLEGAFKYIVDFSTYLAHELKTPLAIIKGESEVTLRKKRSGEEYERVIRSNLGESEKMLKTIDDLLLLAKLDYRPGVYKFETFDLFEFIEEIHERSEILASQKNIVVTKNIPKEPITINASRLHLRRLFFDLIDNAVKFTPRNGQIDITVSRQQNLVSIAVSDTGRGIAEEDLPKIFEKFFRSGKAGQDDGHGTGLGLSIAQSIAKSHQGNIEVKSKLGQGSVFTVILPLP